MSIGGINTWRCPVACVDNEAFDQVLHQWSQRHTVSPRYLDWGSAGLMIQGDEKGTLEGRMDKWNTAAWSEILVQTSGPKQANRWSPMEVNERGEGGNTGRLVGERDCLEAKLTKHKNHDIIPKLKVIKHDSVSCWHDGNLKIVIV